MIGRMKIDIMKNFKKVIQFIEQKIFSVYLTIKGWFSDEVINRPFEVVWVPTDKLNYLLKSGFKRKRYQRFGFNEVRFAGLIMGGDWDKDARRFDKTVTFKAFSQRFKEQKKWEDTDYFDRFYQKLKERGCGREGSKNWEEFKERCLDHWDELCEKIRKEGYNRRPRFKGVEKEIEVGVTRDGQLLFINGWHRLTIAKILEIEEIPVIVNVWHKEFIDKIKKEVQGKITPKVAVGYTNAWSESERLKGG